MNTIPDTYLPLPMYLLGVGAYIYKIIVMQFSKQDSMVALLYFRTTLYSEVRISDLVFCAVLVAQGIHAMGFKCT